MTLRFKILKTILKYLKNYRGSLDPPNLNGTITQSAFPMLLILRLTRCWNRRFHSCGCIFAALFTNLLLHRSLALRAWVLTVLHDTLNSKGLRRSLIFHISLAFEILWPLILDNPRVFFIEEYSWHSCLFESVSYNFAEVVFTTTNITYLL